VLLWFGSSGAVATEPVLGVVGVVALLVGGWPILKEAFESLVERRMTMELSMSLAIAAAAAVGEFFTALMIMVFVLVAEILEQMTVARGRRAIANLLDVLPRTASVRRADRLETVPLEDLAVGDVVLVYPGGLIPVDGSVVGGHSFVDQASVTGEPLPVEKQPGSAVFAGTVNQSGALEIQTEQVGSDTTFGRIVTAVEHAEQSRAPVQRLADRLAGYLVYFALAAAALTFLVTRNVQSTISVIIVAGACGIAAGTPLAILGGIGRAAREGAIVKGGLYLESLGRVDTVILDKTGTLTFGRPSVAAVVPIAGVDADDVLATAAVAELRSEHPLGQAIVERGEGQGLVVGEPDSFAYTPGRGIEATVRGVSILVGNRGLLAEREISVPEDLGALDSAASEVLVAREGRLLGTIAIADTVRPEASGAVAELHRMRLRTVLLTGDRQASATAVAQKLGIEAVEAELLPTDKQARVAQLVAQGRVVAMVGDGINDAPALTAANVGVAMGSGTEVARESADVVLLGNDLSKLVESLAIARWTRRIIWQNFAGTISVDLLGIGLAAFGLLNPLLAAFIHVTSELVFILNSARVLPPLDEQSRRLMRQETASTIQPAP
jgi:Cd2+/Zn2+-exporting ATPase/Cu+-exporting ATPase